MNDVIIARLVALKLCLRLDAFAVFCCRSHLRAT